MTNAQSNDDIERRLSRLESLMNSAGELLIRAANVAERNALDIESLTQDIRRNAVDIRRNAIDIQALAAASERHDRILDYLLRREAGEFDSE